MINISTQIAKEAASSITKVETKESSSDLVTETDKQVEDLVLSELRQKFPSHRYRLCSNYSTSCSL